MNSPFRISAVLAPLGLALTLTGCAGGHSGYVVPPDQAYAGTLTIVSGDAQSATVGTAYAQPMRVRYLDSTGSPQGGAVIVFIGPTSGAGVTFGTATSFETATDNDGYASSGPFQAANQSGSVSVQAAIQNHPVKSTPTFHLTNQ